MKLFKYILLFTSLVITSCGSKKNKLNFKLESDKQTYQLGETVTITPALLSENSIETISYSFQEKKLEANTENKLVVPLNKHLLGKHTINATITSNGNTENIETNITILNNTAPKVYNYEIVNTYPHNETYFTQGLEFVGDTLYESAGQRKKSKLAKVDYKTGKILKEHSLKDNYFAEGLTVIDDKIIQLTWTSNIGFIYDLKTFTEKGTFAYNQSKEGWGLCHNDKYIFKSDGSTKIWKLNAKTLAEEGFIQVATNKALKSRFNELEWVNGKIYANTWQKDGIAIINPNNGAIEGIINLKGIRNKLNISSDDDSRVLNGIAYKKETDQLFVTGKYWKSLFEIKVTD